MVWPWLIATVVCLGLSGFYSGCETGLYCLSAVRLELGRRMGRRRATVLSRMLHDREGIIATTLVGTNLANYLATVCVISILIAVEMAEQRAELVTTLVLTPLIFVFGEITPKNLFRREADRLMYRLIWPLRVSDVLFRATGVIALLKGLARLAARCVGFGRTRTLTSMEPRQRIMAILREGVGAGVLSDDASAIADRVMNLSRVRVRSAMIARRHVHAVAAQTRCGDFIERARSLACSRVPVLDGPGRVVGVLHLLDVLLARETEQGVSRPVTDLMATPLTLDPDQTVTGALTAMQRHGAAMAIVTDSQHRFLGIVTVKDLVEEIVGDLKAW